MPVYHQYKYPVMWLFFVPVKNKLKPKTYIFWDHQMKNQEKPDY